MVYYNLLSAFNSYLGPFWMDSTLWSCLVLWGNSGYALWFLFSVSCVESINGLWTVIFYIPNYTLKIIMGRIIREPWRLNTGWGTVISLSGCSFGFKVDGRCHKLYCKFRCESHKQPEEPVKIGSLLCPRENEYEGLQPNETSFNKNLEPLHPGK